jgi:hypothetical protein
MYSSDAEAWVSISNAGSQGETGAQGTDGVEAGATGVLNLVMSGGGSVISSGTVGFVEIPYNVQFNQWSLYAGETGTLFVSIDKSSYSNFGSWTDIVGSTGPNIIDGIKNQDVDISDWDSPTGAPGDVLRISIDSIDTITVATLALKYNKY